MEKIPSTYVLTNSHKNIQTKFFIFSRDIFVILMMEEILVMGEESAELWISFDYSSL